MAEVGTAEVRNVLLPAQLLRSAALRSEDLARVAARIVEMENGKEEIRMKAKK